jgi:hypothetical protein
MMVDTKFGVGDTVRFIGTDTLLTVREYDSKTLEYQVQRDNDETLECVSEIYLELVKPTSDSVGMARRHAVFGTDPVPGNP